MIDGLVEIRGSWRSKVMFSGKVVLVSVGETGEKGDLGVSITDGWAWITFAISD